jgi:3-methyladenine DNA glycosylase AlkC
MKDTLLTEKHKKEILKSIKEKNYPGIISTLEKIKTFHAGTPKTKDKRFTISEIVKSVVDNSKNHDKDFFTAGSMFCKQKEDVAKEIGVALIWRGYKTNPEKVKDILLNIADDPNWEVREYAGSAFANALFHNHDFYETLLIWTKHPSENVRRAVVFSALALRDKKNLSKAFRLLGILMFDSSKYVKKNLGPFILGSYFGNKFPEETLKQLHKWSKIRDENVRWNIIMAFNNSFGNKYPEEALDILKYFAGDVDLSVKRALFSTLNFLSKRHEKLVEAFKKEHKLSSKKDVIWE